MRPARAGRTISGWNRTIAWGKRNADDADAGKSGRQSWADRKREQARETLEIGTLVLTEPRRVPGRLIELMRRAFRRVWSARGGGLYATGVFVTFFWLETITLVREFTTSDDTGDFVTGQLLDIVLRFSAVSLQNSVYALIWPLALFERYGPYWAGGMLVAMYVIFVGLIKKPLGRWLFDIDAQGNHRQDDTPDRGAGE